MSTILPPLSGTTTKRKQSQLESRGTFGLVARSNNEAYVSDTIYDTTRRSLTKLSLISIAKTTRSAECLHPDCGKQRKKRSKSKPEVTSFKSCANLDNVGQSENHLEVDRNGNVKNTSAIEYSNRKEDVSATGCCNDVIERRNSPLPSSSGTAEADSCSLNDQISRDRKQQKKSGAVRRGNTVKDVEARLLPDIVENNGDNMKGSQQQQHQHQRQESRAPSHPHVVSMSSCLPGLRRTFTSRHIKETSQQPSISTAEEPPATTEDGQSTIAMGILMTSGFVWMPMCLPHRSRSHSEIADALLANAALCPRWHVRRGALCDHMKILLPQTTRVSIEKEVADRKSNMTRKVSQYFKAMYSSDYDVDLV